MEDIVTALGENLLVPNDQDTEGSTGVVGWRPCCRGVHRREEGPVGGRTRGTEEPQEERPHQAWEGAGGVWDGGVLSADVDGGCDHPFA